jgi:transmembrane sensor
MTPNNTPPDEYARIDDEAAAWAARRLSGGFTKDDRAAFDRWLATDKRHVEAVKEYLEIADESAHAGATAGLQSAANDEAKQRGIATSRRWLIAAPAIAASVFAAFFFMSVKPQHSETVRYATGRGETLSVNLPDGSTVTLNTDTAIAVLYEDHQRLVSLESGEAFFEVTRNERAPFIVEAEKAQVRVLGTAFTLHSADDEASVCVHSGTVTVRPKLLGKRDAALRLTAGEHVAIDASGDAGPVGTFMPSEAATWRRGYLKFEETPLADVVEDVNRYFVTQIRLEDPSLGAAPVSGRIELEDQDVAVRALSVALSLRVERRGATIVLKADE